MFVEPPEELLVIANVELAGHDLGLGDDPELHLDAAHADADVVPVLRPRIPRESERLRALVPGFAHQFPEVSLVSTEGLGIFGRLASATPRTPAHGLRVHVQAGEQSKSGRVDELVLRCPCPRSTLLPGAAAPWDRRAAPGSSHRNWRPFLRLEAPATRLELPIRT